MKPPTTRAALAAGGAALALALIAGCGQGAEPGEPEEKTYDEVPELLIVEVDNASLQIVPDDTAQVRVVRTATGDAGGDWELTGDTLSLETECGLVSNCQVQYQVFIPADTALSVETDNGDVTLSGFGAPVEATSDNGTLDLSDLTGPLALTSANGDMNLTGIGSPTLSAATDNGSIDAVFTEAPTEVEVSTNNGDARVELPGGPYAVFETSQNGEVLSDLPTDPSSGSTVTARTDNGTIALVPAD
jgi:hypothetical protein